MGVEHDDEHKVIKVRRFLPPGPLAEGDPPARDARRTEWLVQFYADKGGLRTIRESAIVEIY